MAASSGSHELCKFLLQTSSIFHDETIMRSAFRRAQDSEPITYCWPNVALADELYSLFVGDYDLNYDLKSFGEVLRSAFMYRTEASIQVIMASQPTPLASLTPT